jgi:hypothetical protein
LYFGQNAYSSCSLGTRKIRLLVKDTVVRYYVLATNFETWQVRLHHIAHVVEHDIVFWLISPTFLKSCQICFSII